MAGDGHTDRHTPTERLIVLVSVNLFKVFMWQEQQKQNNNKTNKEARTNTRVPPPPPPPRNNVITRAPTSTRKPEINDNSSPQHTSKARCPKTTFNLQSLSVELPQMTITRLWCAQQQTLNKHKEQDNQPLFRHPTGPIPATVAAPGRG